jgi:hypothetical protein
MRNVTSLKPRHNKSIFKKVPKFSTMLVSLDVALFYLAELYGEASISPAPTLVEVQVQLDKAYAKGDSPWRVVVG